MEEQASPGTKRKPLKARLVLTFSVFCLIALAIPTGILISANFLSHRSILEQNIRLVAEKNAVMFDGYIHSQVQDVETAIWLEDFQNIQPARMKVIFSRLISRFSAFRQFAYFDNEGNLVEFLSLQDLGELKKFLSRVDSHLLNAYHTTGDIMIGRVFIDDITNEPMVVVSFHLKDLNGNKQGNVVAELSLRFMWDLLESKKTEHGAYSYIIDDYGILLAHQDITRVLAAEDLSHIEIVRDFIGSPGNINKDILSYTGINGKQVSGILVGIGNTGWAAITEIPAEESYRIFFFQASFIAILMLGIGFIAAFVGILLSRKISVPITKLTATVSRISGGELDLQAQIEGPEEVVILARAFNSMTVQLKQVLDSQKSQLDALKGAQTELVEVNNRLQALVDHSPLAIIVVDTEGIVRLWNSAAEQIYGFRSDEVLGRTLSVLTDESKEEYMSIRSRVLSTGQASSGNEVRRLRKDGNVIWISLSVAPLVDADGNVTGFISMAEDITDRRRTHEKLAASLHEKEVFLKEIHHRVKNNMQIISSLLDLQAATIENDELDRVFMITRLRIKSMALIHEQLYLNDNLARIDFGRYVEALANNALSSYSGSSDRIRLELNIVPVLFTIESSVPCGLIISEILTNSIKYAFPGDSTGTIRITLEDAGNNRCVLTVEDNGTGFDPALLEGKPRSLGMTLIRELVAQLNGTLELDSVNGTHYRISFVPIDLSQH